MGELRFMGGQQPPDRHAGQEEEKRESCERQRFAKDARIHITVKAEDGKASSPAARVQYVVAFPQQLIQVSGVGASGRVFANHGQVGSGLPVKQAQFLQVRPGQAVQA